MDSTVQEFLELCGKAGIISQSKLDAMQSSISTEEIKDSSVIAARLFELGWLTEFQATEIKDGHAQKLIVGEYLLLDRIGHGGMGQVFRACHCLMQREVAIKFLLPSRTSDEDAARRFRREVQTASKLCHPNIVTALDAGERGEMSYLVMEYVAGSNLAKLVQTRGPMSIQSAIHCLRQAAIGLEYAHRNGIVHRDVKPSNLLLTADEQLKILDMGLARIQPPISSLTPESDFDNLTEKGQFLGTVDFMAPEQALDPRNVDKRADIYSLGCTLYYFLTGDPPYKGDSVTTRIVAHRESPIPSLYDVRPDIPNALDQLFHRMIAKSVKDRYQDMADVIRDLDRCARTVGGRPAGGHDTVTWYDQHLDGPARPSWRLRWLLASAMCCCLALAGWAVTTYYNSVTTEAENANGTREAAFNPELRYPLDLLSRINLSKDVVKGDGWELRNSGLLTGTGKASQLEVPVSPPSEYQLSLRAIRRSGQGPLLIGLPLKVTQCYVLLDRNGISGIGNNARNELLHQTGEIILTVDTPVDIECRVIGGQLQVAIDGETHIAFDGDFSELQVPAAYKLKRQDTFFIATNPLRSGEGPQFEIQNLVLDNLNSSK